MWGMMLSAHDKFGRVTAGYALQECQPRSLHVPCHLPAGGLGIAGSEGDAHVPMALSIKFHLCIAFCQTAAISVRNI